MCTHCDITISHIFYFLVKLNQEEREEVDDYREKEEKMQSKKVFPF